MPAPALPEQQQSHWFDEWQSKAVRDLQENFGHDWQSKHGVVETGEDEGSVTGRLYRCSKSWAQWTDLCTVLQHLMGNEHQRRMAHFQDPLAEVPEHERHVHEARRGRAYCLFCEKNIDEAHLA